jgi:hypothetical protein
LLVIVRGCTVHGYRDQGEALLVVLPDDFLHFVEGHFEAAQVAVVKDVLQVDEALIVELEAFGFGAVPQEPREFL